MGSGQVAQEATTCHTRTGFVVAGFEQPEARKLVVWSHAQVTACR